MIAMLPGFRRWAFPVVALVFWMPAFALAQTNDEIRQRLTSPAPLTAEEIARVLTVTRAAAAGKNFHVSPSPTGTPGLELQVAADGGPVFTRATSGSTTSLTHYTRRAATYCEGSPAPGELVVDYENRGGGWTATVRHSVDAIEVLSPITAALKGILPLEDAGRTVILGRAARGFGAPWRPEEIRVDEQLPGGGTVGRRVIPGAPTPPDARQTLWIDAESLLPARWAITLTEPSTKAPIDYGMFLVQDDRIDLQPPAGVTPPTCIDPRGPSRPGRIR